MLHRLRRVTITLLVLYWIALFVGTHVPLRELGVGVRDKLLHLLAFAGLAFLLAWVICGRRASWRAMLIVLAVAFAYGAVDELSQLLVPGRRCDLWDWVADVAGAVLGWAAYRLLTALLQVFSPPARDATVAASQLP